MPLAVDIVSDVVCPWCIICYKQLMKALAAMPGQFYVTLSWHPFELNPRMPEEGQDLREHIARLLGTDKGRVSVKAKTTEGLGDIGAGNAIACHAVVLLEEHIR